MFFFKQKAAYELRISDGSSVVCSSDLKAVDRIEHAMRTGDSASLVLPAHTLKGEARHFGALSLGDLAETIEMGARRCVDHQETPEELLVPVARLRSMFEQTLAWFDKETNPLVARRKQQNHAS